MMTTGPQITVLLAEDRIFCQAEPFFHFFQKSLKYFPILTIYNQLD